MAAWKKWWISFAMLLQIIVGTVVVSLWFYHDQTWTIPVNDWLHSSTGQSFSAGVAMFLIIVALTVMAVAIFRPTTTKQMVIAKEGANKVQIDQQAVEHSLGTSIAKYDLYNPVIKLKMHRNNRKADVTVHGMLSNRTNPKLIHTVLLQTIKENLKQDFDIDLNKLHVKLSPYTDKKSVVVV
ncbi:alkaline shock response membrane anchor protein AmaP [Lactobacillus sp. Marseille-P7033]|nr:alkaline shock response membrane anchor protein AmaP [Lactobacillus sp. Marseille-P7033]NGC77247.1 alkaline shock response membrane anchor protein AmaP [Limosilactobacillus reuteri]